MLESYEAMPRAWFTIGPDEEYLKANGQITLMEKELLTGYIGYYKPEAGKKILNIERYKRAHRSNAAARITQELMWQGKEVKALRNLKEIGNYILEQGKKENRDKYWKVYERKKIEALEVYDRLYREFHDKWENVLDYLRRTSSWYKGEDQTKGKEFPF